MNGPMEDDSNRKVVDSSLTFFGKVTASVSHELNNVISIIDQTGGLLQDLIAGEERGIPITTERLSQAVTSILKQTGRGLEIIKRMNRFAHSADFPVTEFDANETIDNLVALTRRLADLKRARLEYKTYPAELMVTGNPFLLQQVIFGMIGLMLADAERDDIYKITVGSDNSLFSVAVAGPSRGEADNKILTELRELSGGIGGQLKIYVKDESIAYNLMVPMRLPETS